MTSKIVSQPNPTPPSEWLTLSDALHRISPPSSEAEAWDRLLVRMKTGVVGSVAKVIEETVLDDQPDISEDVPVSRSTWTHMSGFTLIDVSGGVVTAHGNLPDGGPPLTITMHGLELNEKHIADLLGPPLATPTKRGPGRPHGPFWPIVAEELAVLVHEEGVPDHSVPIAQVVNQLLDRIAVRGLTPPSFGTIRPVVDAVLARLR